MSNSPNDLAAAAWKRQFDTALRILETLIEGAGKARESQLAASVEAHASIVAARKALEGATTLAEVARIQSDWLTQNLNRSAAYWMGLGTVARETQSRIVGCLFDPAQAAAWINASSESAGSKLALNEMLDNAYRSWLDSLRQLYWQPASKARVKA